jgi:hypothetical protein
MRGAMLKLKIFFEKNDKKKTCGTLVLNLILLRFAVFIHLPD